MALSRIVKQTCPTCSKVAVEKSRLVMGDLKLVTLECGHMITEDVNSNGSGLATLTFVPALRTSPADNAAIVVNNPKGLFRLMDNTFAWSVDPGPLYRFSFQAVEVLIA